jgi:hypothetical protein
MTIQGTTINDLVPSEKALGARVDLVLKEQNPIINSGLAATGPEVDAVLNGGARKQGLAYIEPLDASNVNISTDDINEQGASGKLTADEFNVLRHEQNWAWGYTDLARMVTQYDAKGGIEAGIGQYWNTRFQKTTVSSVKGVQAHIEGVLAYSGTDAALLAKKAAYAGLVSGSTSTDFSMNTVLKAAATALEYQDMFDVMIVHPTLYALFQSQETSGFLTPAQTGTKFATYKGYKLLKSVAFGETQMAIARSGAIAFGARSNEIEINRLANAGTGGGATLLHSRQGFVSHVQGTNYAGSVAPDLTALENAATWELEVAPEHFGFRFIKYKKPA